MISKELSQALSKLLKKQDRLSVEVKNEIRSTIKNLERLPNLEDSEKIELCGKILKKLSKELDQPTI